jgi:DNA-binding response OmpR family regulator
MNTPQTILYVEDDQNDALLVRRALHHLRSEVALHTVEDVETAIAYLAGEGMYADRERYPLPSMVLLDIKIPGRSGMDLLGWVREKEALQGVPVVMFTSSMVESDIKLAYQLGANSYIVKPVSFVDLMEKLRGIVEVWLRINLSPGLST